MLICVKVERKCFNSEGVTSTSGLAKKWIKLSSNVTLFAANNFGVIGESIFTGPGGGLVFTKRKVC